MQASPTFPTRAQSTHRWWSLSRLPTSTAPWCYLAPGLHNELVRYKTIKASDSLQWSCLSQVYLYVVAVRPHHLSILKTLVWHLLRRFRASTEISGSPHTFFSTSCQVSRSSTAWGTTFSSPACMAAICDIIHSRSSACLVAPQNLKVFNK